MKIGCVINIEGRKYERLGECAKRSFAKWHPDIPLHCITPSEHLVELASHEPLLKQVSSENFGTGIMNFIYALALMKKHSYDKIIILGADTLTCARLNEFIDNNEDDILVSLGMLFPLVYPVFHPDIKTFSTTETPTLYHPDDPEKITYAHYNSDVVCFNTRSALEEVISASLLHVMSVDVMEYRHQVHKINMERITKKQQPATTDIYFEMGGLNIITSLSHYNQTGYFGPELDLQLPSYKVKCVDGPLYEDSEVSYNVQSKGPDIPADGEKPWKKYTNKFYVKDDALFTGDHKRIKVWHYADGFYALEDEEFEALINKWISEWFNEDTKVFFADHCDSGDFFEKEFKLDTAD